MEWRLQPHPQVGHPNPPQGQSSSPQETYIVQFPREQVYYVPPPENTVFVERRRNSPKPKSPPETKYCCCCPRWLILTLILLCLIAIIGVAITILYFLYKPTYPSFSVAKMAVPTNSSRPVYEITLMANNPNARSGLEYQKSDDVSLVSDKGISGNGKFPGLKQEAEASSRVRVEIRGNNNSKRIINEGVVTFELEIGISVTNDVGNISLWTMNCNVACLQYVVNSSRIN
ncbi:NDR1/HIN1-like protein 13 [Senna tora]|uniref:NDR1/HIN1-like protein 13 n=1 Tax=Senna tora TaxID=362788 RepID=A0A834WXR0_9FABA|nr:NDR1/HIN1-like protein 13 [Senna tora]